MSDLVPSHLEAFREPSTTVELLRKFNSYCASREDVERCQGRGSVVIPLFPYIDHRISAIRVHRCDCNINFLFNPPFLPISSPFSPFSLFTLSSLYYFSHFPLRPLPFLLSPTPLSLSSLFLCLSLSLARTAAVSSRIYR